MQVVPRHRRTEKDESAEIQDHIDRRVEGVVACLGLGMIHAIPVQGASSDKTGQRLIRPKAATRSDNKKLKSSQYRIRQRWLTTYTDGSGT